LPKSRDSRSAINGVTARSSLNSSWIVCRETLRATANALAVKPNSGMKSSRNISPGCVGGTWRDSVFKIDMVASLMVVCDLDIVGIAVPESKTDAPLVVDRDGELAFSIPVQSM
jgi:hypothetical protein